MKTLDVAPLDVRLDHRRLRTDHQRQGRDQVDQNLAAGGQGPSQAVAPLGQRGVAASSKPIGTAAPRVFETYKPLWEMHGFGDEAAAIKKKFEDAGAKVEVK